MATLLEQLPLLKVNPALQFKQLVALEQLTHPAGQETQEPLAPRYVPAAHCVQIVLPLTSKPQAKQLLPLMLVQVPQLTLLLVGKNPPLQVLQVDFPELLTEQLVQLLIIELQLTHERRSFEGTRLELQARQVEAPVPFTLQVSQFGINEPQLLHEDRSFEGTKPDWLQARQVETPDVGLRLQVKQLLMTALQPTQLDLVGSGNKVVWLHSRHPVTPAPLTSQFLQLAIAALQATQLVFPEFGNKELLLQAEQVVPSLLQVMQLAIVSLQYWQALLSGFGT